MIIVIITSAVILASSISSWGFLPQNFTPAHALKNEK